MRCGPAQDGSERRCVDRRVRRRASRLKSGSANDEEARRAALRLVDGGVCRALPQRRAAADGVSRPGSDRDQCEPVRSRARRRFVFIMRRAVWAECRGCGATCAAAWGWCRFTFAMRRARPERRWSSGVPVAQIVPGEGVVLEGGERIAARMWYRMRTRARHCGCLARRRMRVAREGRARCRSRAAR